jgi:hypothetical protein
VVAQYATLLTFGAALILDVGLYQGLDPLLLGCALVLANMAVIGVVVAVSSRRYSMERSHQRKMKARRAQAIEWACEFTPTKFETTLDEVERAHLLPSHAMAFHYCSLMKAQQCIKSGIGATMGGAFGASSPGGVLFSLHRPHELTPSDDDFFADREAVLACALPWSLLQPHPAANSPPFICVVESTALQALRGIVFNGIPDPRPWYEGGVFLPPQRIVRAYQLDETESIQIECGHNPAMPMSNVPTQVRDGKINEDCSFAISGLWYLSAFFVFVANSTHASVSIASTVSVQSPRSVLEFASAMASIRTTCSRCGWKAVFHFTDPTFAPLILRSGLRMSKQGQRGQDILQLN